jgi:hypothetical protein
LTFAPKQRFGSRRCSFPYDSFLIQDKFQDTLHDRHARWHQANLEYLVLSPTCLHRRLYDRSVLTAQIPRHAGVRPPVEIRTADSTTVFDLHESTNCLPVDLYGRRLRRAAHLRAKLLHRRLRQHPLLHRRARELPRLPEHSVRDGVRCHRQLLLSRRPPVCSY